MAKNERSYHGNTNPRVSIKKMDRVRKWADEIAAAPAETFQGMPVEPIGPPQFDDDRDIWERQTEEPQHLWHMFTVYRDMPTWNRTKRGVASVMDMSKGRGGVGTGDTILNASTMFRWDERVVAYDLAADKRMREELYQRRLSARVETAQLGHRMRVKANEALSALNTVVYKSVKNPETGEIERVIKSALSPNDIAKLADVGVKLERLALGEDSSALPPGSTLNLTQVNTQIIMSDEELIASASEIISGSARKIS